MCATSFLNSPFCPIFIFPDIDENELVRIFRMVIQMLREPSQAPTTTDRLRQKVERAIEIQLWFHRCGKETQKYLRTKAKRFEFVFTPKHGSWLNLIESFFSKIARSFLRHIRVQSKEELVNRIYRGIQQINEEPVLFRWHYKMNEIMPT